MGQRNFEGGYVGCLGFLDLRGFRTTRRRSRHVLHHSRSTSDGGRACLRSLTSRSSAPPHYQRLFHLTRVMAREWLPSTIPRKEGVISIRESLRDWYFGEDSGGMFLSLPARVQYFRLHNELEKAIAGLGDDAESLSKESAAELRQQGSDLRHQLAADLGVAERPRTRWIMPAKTQPPPLPE